MTSALDIVRGALARFPSGVTGKCQQWAGTCWEVAKGRATPQSYGSARAAMLASGPLNKDPMAAPPGAYHYWHYVDGAGNHYDHVAFALGSGSGRPLCAMNSGNRSGLVQDLGKNIFITDVRGYNRTYYGWAMTNGAREAITGITDPYAPQVAPNQRQVKPSSDANIRDRAAKAGADVGDLKAGTIITPVGFERGVAEGGIDIWLKLGDRRYAWAGGMTDAGTHDLPDLTPPPPPVIRKVTIDYADGVNAPKVLEVKDGGQVAKPSDPGKPGWTFAYWAGPTGAAFDFTTRVTSDLTLKAIYDRIVHVVTVDYGNGGPGQRVEVNHGDLVPEPTAPAKEGWTFTGWQAAGEPYDFATPVTSDLALVAGYEAVVPALHTVTLVYEDGSTSELRVVDGSPIGLVPEPPVLDDWQFKGWYVEGSDPATSEPYDFTGIVRSDLRLLAVYTRDEQPTEPTTPTKPPALSRGVIGTLVAVGGAALIALIAWLANLGG